MPIGGGTFTAMNKILPGAYINFVAAGNVARLGERGIATIPLPLNWGEEGKIIRIDAADFNQTAMALLGYDPTAPELLLVREALKGATTLLVGRVNGGGTKASATIGGLSVTALHAGTRGNALAVVVRENLDDASLFEVITTLDQREMDRQVVSESSSLTDNAFVAFSGDALSAEAATPLSGGTNGTEDGAAYAAYLTAVEVETFHAIGYSGTDESIKALIAAFVKRLRYDEGKKVVGVLYDYPGDDIGLINVKNGVVLRTGETLPGDQAVAWVTGATAGAAINESLNTYDGAVDVDIKYTKSQYEQAIRDGEFVFYAESGSAKVLADINSLTTFGGGLSEGWTSNRVVRVMDGWANDVARIFGQSYQRVASNNQTGRALFKADLVSLGNQYQDIEAISDFSGDDLTVEQGLGKSDVVAAGALHPVGSMEILYMTVHVS